MRQKVKSRVLMLDGEEKLIKDRGMVRPLRLIQNKPYDAAQGQQAHHKWDAERIEYEMRSHGRTQKIRVTVHEDGRVVVTKPSYVPDFIADLYVQNEKEWIREQLR